MARSNARREAYTAGGEAALLSLEIRNVGAFSIRSLGSTASAASGEALADRPGSENVRIAVGWLARKPGRPCPVHVQKSQWDARLPQGPGSCGWPAPRGNAAADTN